MNFHGGWNNIHIPIGNSMGYNEICIHVGNPHNLKTPVINWKTQCLLLGIDTSTASKNAEWRR